MMMGWNVLGFIMEMGPFDDGHSNPPKITVPNIRLPDGRLPLAHFRSVRSGFFDGIWNDAFLDLSLFPLCLVSTQAHFAARLCSAHSLPLTWLGYPLLVCICNNMHYLNLSNNSLYSYFSLCSKLMTDLCVVKTHRILWYFCDTCLWTQIQVYFLI